MFPQQFSWICWCKILEYRINCTSFSLNRCGGHLSQTLTRMVPGLPGMPPVSIYFQAFQGELKISIFWVFLRGSYLRWLSEIEIWKLEHTDSDYPSGCLQPSGRHRRQHTAGLSWPGGRPDRPGKDLIITNWSHNRDPSLQDEPEIPFTKERSVA